MLPGCEPGVNIQPGLKNMRPSCFPGRHASATNAKNLSVEKGADALRPEKTILARGRCGYYPTGKTSGVDPPAVLDLAGPMRYAISKSNWGSDQCRWGYFTNARLFVVPSVSPHTFASALRFVL